MIFDQFIPRDWPRANKAHIPAQNIPKLGQLIQARLAQKSTKTGHSRIIAELVMMRPFPRGGLIEPKVIAQHSLGIGDHGAQFPTGEFIPVPPDTAVPVKPRSALRFKNTPKRRDDHNSQGCKAKRQADIHPPLGPCKPCKPDPFGIPRDKIDGLKSFKLHGGSPNSTGCRITEQS